MKKQALIMGIAVILVLTAVVGGTIAAPTISANKNGETTINIEDMEVALAASTEASVTEFNISKAVPGYMAECPEYVVKNGTKGGYDLYARVTIDKQWKSTDGSIEEGLDASMMHLYFSNGEELSKDNAPEGWIVTHVTSEQIVMYYTSPLLAGDSNNTSTSFLNDIYFDLEMDNKYTDKTAYITITTDAVQTSVVEKAMVAQWGVKPTIDANGVITAITE